MAAIHDARQVSSRAASILVARSASGNAMPWLSMIGPPNASRRLAYSVAYSSAALAIPSACAATIGRVCSKVPSVAEPECLAALDDLAGLGQLVLELVLAAEQVRAGNPHAVELQLGGVRGAAAELVELAHHFQARACRRAR